MTRLETLEAPTVLDDTKSARVRHYVRKRPDGTLEHVALCGYLWDMIPAPSPDDSICEECMKIARREAFGDD